MTLTISTVSLRPESFLLLPQDGLLLVDAQGVVLHVNSIARRRLSVTPQAFNGRSLGELWPELAELIERRTDWDTTGPRDETVVWAGAPLSVRTFRTDSGVGVGVLAGLLEPETPGPRQSLVENVLEAVSDAVVVTTAEYLDFPGPVILYVNSAFLAQTGYALNEVLGRSPRLLQGPMDEDPSTRSRLRGALQKGERTSLELVNTAKDGTQYWVEIDLVPLLDGTGAVTQWVSVQRNISERRTTQQALAEQALQDPVTGLPNRFALHSRIDQALQRLNRREGQMAVLFCDLNRFKEVNDMHGHHVGDQLLVEIAFRLREALRPEDTLARLGGDEFVAIAENLVEEADAVQLALRLKERLGAPWAIDDQTSIRPSMSVGIAITAEASVTVDELLRRADMAMYQAKESTGAGVAIYDRSVDDQLKMSISVRRQLHQAIEGGGLVLEYQPIVELSDGSIHGAEALVRLRGSDGLLIPPSDFIPQAEVTGLVVPLGEWVIHQAFSDLKTWRDRGRPYAMSVNVSPSQLRVPGLGRYLLEQAELMGIDPRWVAIEVTETVLINHPKVTYDELSLLREAGVKVHLDDFGTGYSSLSWLTQFPVDAIKIDKTFTADLGIDERKTAIIRAFIQVAQELEFAVVAEGIETELQKDWLKRMGCDRGQGYLFSTPLRMDTGLWA
ncbi:EAL domain-containing protein [Cyanobium sp. Morenito 9A2]|uniref:putative bifunctional diguanylate cyclase/phosphodiesterase n=1 Tax=Cyanobium sp. Morenito 9A2 TaxID=2823718 RepID=UPI0020CE0005|nr:EAL domain-containing protein [Cyanobium sp. Morenito 9A2]MCP9848596.1 EAL domain-containing protein [Cyanobium sp. Morenito 9A2]